MTNPIQVESTRARTLGWVAAVLGTIALAAMLIVMRTELSTRRFPERLAFSYYVFYLPGLAVAAAGLAFGLVARPMGKREGDARREAMIGIILSILSLIGLVAVRLWGAWFIGAKA
jgi:hypothetical protein